jgi:ZIP family zinc transporter
MDGLGIGLAFQVSPAAGVVVAAGVLAHDFADGVNTFVLAFSGGARTRTALLWLVADALAPICGIVASMMVHVEQRTLATTLGVFCGFFLYVGASELLPQSIERSVSRWSLLATPAGLAAIYVAVRMASA